jgi:hypothetical protein
MNKTAGGAPLAESDVSESGAMSGRGRPVGMSTQHGFLDFAETILNDEKSGRQG